MQRSMLLFFCMFILVMSWEGQRDALAVFASSHVPQNSIRLRILANSDSLEDQNLKRHVRDQVIQSVKKWSGQAQDEQAARTIINQHLPELRQVVNDDIKQQGFSYTAHVDLTPTDFPTKMYGSQVFPAGKYEAVRISIGQAEGANWWCVLFPPLCFVDIANGDTTDHIKKTADGHATTVAASTGIQNKDKNQVQVRFFLVDMFYKIADFFKA
ncbi:stage II sporulation protein R [Aneurinibacillus sp. Ricciae_BoGa-3]|uniref:stage II sporulation protein R n=1 Tax=Aneurinibacillus sp. Ricciae_BoGa-3 TaxID=3022697 RepID=UPI0023425D3E|nr:stage II sporulation protein R [Aneurinibacillus sp. Ricciae_BoGa-3]WCK54363.1 stage II sporulation protein R [Aneurinibacillus sp. Ricciae_BoGa-3]